MERKSLADFTKWWFIGDFEPSLQKTTDFEVAVKTYKKWDKEESHYHKIATEYTVINTWRFKMNWEVLWPWDIMCVYPNDVTDFECLEDGSNTVVKVPCVKGDKYLFNE